MSKFECHITFDYKGDDVLLKLIEELVVRHGFKFSFITNDPVLGNKTFAYGTKYGAFKDGLIADMQACKLEADRTVFAYDCVRIKVEEIVFDERY